MISLEKSYILTPLQKLPKNVRDSGKIIVANGYKKLPKVQKSAQSGHTGSDKGCNDLTIYSRVAFYLLCQIFRDNYYKFCTGSITTSFSFYFRPFLIQ